MFARSTAFTVPRTRDTGVNDVAIAPSSSSMSAFAIVAVAACENGAVVGFDERAPSEGRCAFEVSTTTTGRRDDDEANCVVWGVDGSSSLYFARGSTVFETDVRRLGCGDDDASSAVIRTFDEASDGVNGVDIDAKGELLAACDDDGGIVVYDLKTGGVRRRLKGHTGCVTSVRFRHGKRGSGECVSAATDCRVMKWDVGSKPVPVRTWETRAMRGVDDLIREESVADDNDGDNDKGTEKDASDSARAFNPPMAHSVAVFDGVASDENVPGARRVLATACGDGTIAVIDMDHPGCGSGGSKKKKSASTGVFRSGKAECVRLGASDLATSALDPSIRHTAAATCAEFAPWNPRGDIIVSGGTDRRLIAWNWVSAASATSATSASSASTGAIASVKRSRKINALAFAHASPRLAVADTGPSIAVYDVGS